MVQVGVRSFFDIADMTVPVYPTLYHNLSAVYSNQNQDQQKHSKQKHFMTEFLGPAFRSTAKTNDLVLQKPVLLTYHGCSGQPELAPLHSSRPS